VSFAENVAHRRAARRLSSIVGRIDYNRLLSIRFSAFRCRIGARLRRGARRHLSDFFCRQATKQRRTSSSGATTSLPCAIVFQNTNYRYAIARRATFCVFVAVFWRSPKKKKKKKKTDSTPIRVIFCNRTGIDHSVVYSERRGNACSAT
jgi:hypothetical protein